MAQIISVHVPGTMTTINTTVHSGIALPEFGLRYVLKNRWHVGFEPLSLPIFFNGSAAALSYRLLVYAGANF